MSYNLSATLRLDLRRAALTGYWRAALGSGLAFVLLSILVALRLPWELDLRLALAGHVDAPCWALNLSEATSPLVAGEVCLLYAAALGLWCLAQRRPRAAVWLISLMFATVAVEFLFKFDF